MQLTHTKMHTQTHTQDTLAHEDAQNGDREVQIY